MRTQFFQDMVDQAPWVLQCYIIPYPNVLYLETVVGAEEAAKVYNTYPDSINPLKSAANYRAMLRDQYLTLARLRAKGVVR